MKTPIKSALCAFLVFGAMKASGQDSQFAPAPAGAGLINPSYLVDFDEGARIAHWVHYELAAEESNGAVSRTDDFRRDLYPPLVKISWCSPMLIPIQD